MSFNTDMSDEVARNEIQKRFTLNWLIQGAAQHAGMTFHHLVRDELNALEPKLVRLYDQYALINLLQYWQPEVAILLGSPARFWRQAASKRTHPFFGHALLAKYGGTLAQEARKRALERSKEKGLTRFPFAFSFQTTFCVFRLSLLESSRRTRLVRIAKKAAAMVWGIPDERLEANLEDRIILAPDRIRVSSLSGAFFRAGIVGYGCVEQRGNELMVVAKATNWQLLAKEMVKGTAELICLHGLNKLSDATYRQVVETTDRVEFEPWMLQSGGELWRRLLEALPVEASVARVLMHLARLPASDLESIIADVIEGRESARGRLARLAVPASND